MKIRNIFLIIGTIITVGSTFFVLFKEIVLAYANTPYSDILLCGANICLFILIVLLGVINFVQYKRNKAEKKELREKEIPEIVKNILNPYVNKLHVKIDNLAIITETQQQSLKSHIIHNQNLLGIMFGKIVGQTPPPAPKID